MRPSTLFHISGTTGVSSTEGSSNSFTGSTFPSGTIMGETTSVSSSSQEISTPSYSGASTTGQEGSTLGYSGASTAVQQSSTAGSSGSSTSGEQSITPGSPGSSTTGEEESTTGSSGGFTTGQQTGTPGVSGASTTVQQGSTAGSSGSSTSGEQSITPGSPGSSTTGEEESTPGSSGVSTTGEQTGTSGLYGASTTVQQGSTAGSSGISTTVGTSPLSGQTTVSAGTNTGSTTKRCEEMQAIDKTVSEHIIVMPTEISNEEKVQFQPTSAEGVSFPKDEMTPTLTVTFEKPVQVQSVTIPRHKTPNANVEQFAVTFYSPDGNEINTVPIISSTSPQDDETKPAHLDSSQIPSDVLVSHLNITIIKTTDDESPAGVILDVKACTEPLVGKY
jgi:hypothetical protein